MSQPRAHWCIGPLVVDVRGVAPPRDWATCAADSDRACDFVVDAERAELAHSDDVQVGASVCVTARDGDGLVHARRAHGFDATIDYVRGTARYRGIVDVNDAATDTYCPIIESFLRVLAAGALLRRGGALFHASSVIVRGRAYVFAGVSGAGKTTLVEHMPDGAYLSDDQSILTIDRGGAGVPPPAPGFVAWGTPFSGSARRRAPPISAPLAALVLLDPARPARTTLTLPSRAEGVRTLLRHLCAHETGAVESGRALDVAAQIVRTTKTVLLARHIDTSLDEIIERIDALSPTDAAPERAGGGTPAPPLSLSAPPSSTTPSSATPSSARRVA